LPTASHSPSGDGLLPVSDAQDRPPEEVPVLGPRRAMGDLDGLLSLHVPPLCRVAGGSLLLVRRPGTPSVLTGRYHWLSKVIRWLLSSDLEVSRFFLPLMISMTTTPKL
ncbi:unnamed protein product, partial [Urochloa humidicola]